MNYPYSSEFEKERAALRERWYEKNSNFVWTKEAIEHIRLLNEQLIHVYRKAYDEVNRLKKEFDERFENGDEAYSSYEIEVEFWYNHGPCNSPEEDELWEKLVDYSFSLGPQFGRNNRRKTIPSFEEELNLFPERANAIPFKAPELDDINIHYFMTDIFGVNRTYSLEEAVQMKAENFSWQTKICLEHWGKSVKKNA